MLKTTDVSTFLPRNMEEESAAGKVRLTLAVTEEIFRGAETQMTSTSQSS